MKTRELIFGLGTVAAPIYACILLILAIFVYKGALPMELFTSSPLWLWGILLSILITFVSSLIIGLTRDY